MYMYEAAQSASDEVRFRPPAKGKANAPQAIHDEDIESSVSEHMLDEILNTILEYRRCSGSPGLLQEISANANRFNVSRPGEISGRIGYVPPTAPTPSTAAGEGHEESLLS